MHILSSMEMTEADRLAIASGIDSLQLMQNAGMAVAHAANELVTGGRILIVAGRGNNGGDGFVAATELARLGRDVSVMLLCKRDTLEGDAARAAASWRGEVIPFSAEGVAGYDLIVDALFGTGLNRVVKGDPLSVIDAINLSGKPVLSVDLPSGINGTSGIVMGGAVRATATITFFRPNSGHLLMPGRAYCGRLSVVDIGIPSSVLDVIRPAVIENGPEFWGDLFPVPVEASHKYVRGHVLAVSGGMTSTGAARLAAIAALRTCAGVVTVASPRDALAVNAAALTEVMVRPVETVEEFSDFLSAGRVASCVLGPGNGVNKRTRELTLDLLKSGKAGVLDADALTCFAGEPETLFTAIKAAGDVNLVLTPHEGEFVRLFSDLNSKAVMKSKLDRVRTAAQRCGAVVLLKGADTVIAAPDGRACISVNGVPWLATAGSGDVLAGITAALLANSVPAFEAACMGAWLHGEAGREAGPGLIAGDLPAAMPAVLRRLYLRLGVTI